MCAAFGGACDGGLRRDDQVLAVGCVDSARCQDLLGGLFPQQRADGTTLTDALIDKFTRQTRLAQVDEGGDFAFEGEITGYSSTTASVASDDYALLNRLSITVKVRFTNVLDEAMSFNKSFTAYADYDSTKLLTEVAGELVPEIVDQLVNDIFQAAASNW